MIEAVNTCHQNGKIMTVSIGGWDTKITLESEEEGDALGLYIYNTFLGGDGPDRPFGDAILDG